MYNNYLHWLKVNERIEYKLLSLTYKVLTTSQPIGLASPPDLPSATSSQLDVRPSRLVTVGDRYLALLGQSSGTVSLMTLHRHHRCQFSERN